MKKILSFLLMLCMVLALSLKPSAVFATDLTETSLKNITYTTADGAVTISNPSSDITFDGCTFEKGAYLNLDAKNNNVIIKNCTFKDPVYTKATAHFEYAGYIFNAKSVQLLNNTVSGSYRGFDVDISDSNATLTATGNKITLTKITDVNFAEKNVGIQLANHNGSTWNAANINIYNNTFTNVTTAVRLHSTFVLADSNPIVLGTNTIIGNGAYVGSDPDTKNLSADALAALTANVNNAKTNASEVTANADVAYTVIIPQSVNFGTIKRTWGTLTGSFNIGVTDAYIEEGKEITVKASNLTGINNNVGNMFNKDGSGNIKLPFWLDKSSFEFTQSALANGSATIANNVHCNTASLTAAGSYKGYVNFDINYVVAQ